MIDGLEIVRKANARRMKLSVDPRTGQVRLVLPHKAPLAAALTWAGVAPISEAIRRGIWVRLMRILITGIGSLPPVPGKVKHPPETRASL